MHQGRQDNLHQNTGPLPPGDKEIKIFLIIHISPDCFLHEVFIYKICRPSYYSTMAQNVGRCRAKLSVFFFIPLFISRECLSISACEKVM